MNDPTIHEVIEHVATYYGLTRQRAAEIMRTPTAPCELRDEFAKAAIVGAASSWGTANGTEEPARFAYQIADAMLEARK